MNDKQSASRSSSSDRKYLCVMFECCHVYNRIYKNRAGAAYVGWCPRCARKVTIPIESGGTSCRFFKVH